MTAVHGGRAPWEDPYEVAADGAWDDQPVTGDELPPVEEDEAPHSWRPVNLDAVLDGTAVRPYPDVGARSDGAAVLYPGKVHTVSGESEAGKTWFAVAILLTELAAGHGTGVIDFEDDEIGWVSRLVDAGANPDDIRAKFFYIRPSEALGPSGRLDLSVALHETQPTAVVLDGITEAMTLHGLDPLKNAEVAQFGLRLPRWVARRGPAVLCTDHLTKASRGDDGTRGRYALGAVHKLNGLDGAAFIMENRHSFGIGCKGVSTVSLAKDRPGGLRQVARPSKGMDWFADLIVNSQPGAPLEVELAAPAPAAESASGPPGVRRPTAMMATVCDLIEGNPGQLSRRQLEDRLPGAAKTKRLALDLVVEEGFVAVEPGTRGAKNHRLLRPFTEGRD
jgi:hypothetical protein